MMMTPEERLASVQREVWLRCLSVGDAVMVMIPKRETVRTRVREVFATTIEVDYERRRFARATGRMREYGPHESPTLAPAVEVER
jgi:hypothetical protein